MNALNSILLEGRVAGPVVLDESPEGLKQARFRVESDRFFRASAGDPTIKKETSTFDVVAYGRLAESCTQNLGDGRGARLIGRLRTLEDVAVDGKGREYAPVVIVPEDVVFKPAMDRTSGTDA